MVCDADLLGPMAMLFAWASNRQIADEACEIFYQRNVFLVHCEDIPTFLGARIHKMLSVDVSSFMHKQVPKCVRSFDTKEWVTHVDVVIERDNADYSRYLAYQLRYLLECPRLQKLTIKAGCTTVMSWEKEWTGVLNELHLKIGKGLKVIYTKSSFFPQMIADPGALFPDTSSEQGGGDGDVGA